MRFFPIPFILSSIFIAFSNLTAQSVQPVIMEYGAHAEGKFAVTNNTLEPMIITIEPRSFDIGADGRGSFRKLDSSIHLELSAMSLRLLPLQTYYVFYKASAETVPAWFSIYTTFTPAHHGSSLEVRIQLPHTVYLYQKKPIEADSISVQSLTYDKLKKKIVMDVKNVGTALGRVQEIHPMGAHGVTDAIAGFPLLPGAIRHLEIAWNEKEPPHSLQMLFPHFTFKHQIVASNADQPSHLDASTGQKEE